MKLLRYNFALIAFACSAFAGDVNVQVSPVNMKIEWILGGAVHTSHGTFQLRRGDVWFNPESGKARGELVVDAASGESGNGLRDGRMRNSILEVKTYPDIVFRPDSILGKVNLTGESEFTMHGMFRIHGEEHEITIPVKTNIKGEIVETRLEFDIPYVKWGMKDPSTFVLKVDKTVKIKITAEGHLGRGL